MKTRMIEIDMKTNTLIEANRLDFDETHNDIVQRCLESINERTSEVKINQIGQSTAPPTISKSRRSSGHYEYRLFHVDYSESSLKAAYVSCLRSLQARDSAFYSTIAEEETRARRIIANEPEKLYKNTPELAAQHAERIDGNWYVDVNLSESQVIQRLKIACKVAGIEFGSDLELNFH